MESIEKIKKDLKENLSEYRYEHSLRVAEEASKLAKIYQVDGNVAYLVGLVHDIAKEFTEQENKKVLEESGIDIKNIDLSNNRIAHADIGAIVAHERYGFTEEMCHAIKCHTIGDEKMNMLDKIIFIADKIEPGKDYPGIQEERYLAYKDIDQALILCIENNHKKLIANGKKINPRSVEILKSLSLRIEQK